MSTKILTDRDFQGVSRILNLLDAVADQEPATFAQLKAAVEGLNWKDNVRVAAASNVNIASPGANVDGIAMAAGDRVLLMSQTSQPENGIYVWNGAAVPATRSLDCNTANELESAITTVDEGTSALSSFRQNTVNFVLGTNNVVWGAFGTAVPAASETVAGKLEIATQAETDTGTDDLRAVTPLKLTTWVNKPKRAAASFGDGSATQYDVTHNFGTKDVIVQVYRVASPFDVIECDIERPDNNTARLKFAVAPTTNQFRAVVLA